MGLVQFFLLFGFAIISGCESQEEARQREADNMLKQVGLAMQNYQLTFSEPLSSKQPDEDDAKGP